MRQHLDLWSRAIILITLILFVAALFIKGLGHDMLLEAGVFLVSVKLIMMAYKNSVATAKLEDRLESLHAALTRLERLLDSGLQAHAQVNDAQLQREPVVRLDVGARSR